MSQQPDQRKPQRNDSLSKISIQNFKAFGEMVDVPIRPITLIFGENSSGKSSILHSLLFLNAIINDNELDYKSHDNELISLGGMKNFTHNKKLDKILSLNISNRLRVDDTFFNYTIQISINTMNSNNPAKIEYLINNFSVFYIDNITNLNQNSDTLSFRPITFDLTFPDTRIIQNVENDININSNVMLNVFEKIKIEIEKIFTIKPSNSDSIDSLTIQQLLNIQQINLINLLDNLKAKQTTDKRKLVFHMRMEKNYSLTTLNAPLDYRLHINDITMVNFDSSYIKELISLMGISIIKMIQLYNSMAKQLFDKITYLGPLRVIPPRNWDISEFSFLSNTNMFLASIRNLRRFDDDMNEHKNIIDGMDKHENISGFNAWQMIAQNHTVRNNVNTMLSKLKIPYSIHTQDAINPFRLAFYLSKDDTQDIQKLYTNMLKANSNIQEDIMSPDMYFLKNNDPELVKLYPKDLGVGISQVIPITVNCVANSDTTVLIEQPELHLHPRLQGDLADLFIDTAIKGEQQNTYIIETHSEHIIRRIMRRIREDQHKSANELRITKDDVAILYVASGPNGSTVTHLRLDDEGDLIDEWPNGFFEESFRDDIAGR